MTLIWLGVISCFRRGAPDGVSANLARPIKRRKATSFRAKHAGT
jgi:hypothetical protein